MKNTSRFILEAFFTTFVALILSALVALVLLIISASTGMTTQWASAINSITSVIFGIIIGYKLNTLVRVHISKAAKK